MIYVYSHKNFDYYPYINDNYCAISHTEIISPFKKNIIIKDNDILQHEWGYAEICGLEYLYKNNNILPDVIGYAHYRDWYTDDNLGDYDAIIPVPINANPRYQYSLYHDVNDYDKIINIIKEKYPDYNTNIDKLYTRNMFISKKEHFIKYCDFLFDVLNEFNKRNKLQNDDDIQQYVIKNLTQHICTGNTNPKYQARLQGFLSERITSIFIENYFKNMNIRYDNIILSDR